MISILTKRLARLLVKGEKLENKTTPNIETSWSLETGFEDSFDINVQLLKLLKDMRIKQDILNEIMIKFNLNINIIISIVIYCSKEGSPAIYLEKETIQFLSQIDAMIDIDIYR